MKLSSDINLSGLASSLSFGASASSGFEEQLKQKLKESASQKGNLEPEIREKDSVKGKEDKKLRQAVQDFEAFFISQMLKSMRKTIPDGGLFEKGHKEKIMEDMLDESLSKSLAQNRGMGLASALYNQMQPPTSQKRHSEIGYSDSQPKKETKQTQPKQQSIMEIGG